LSSPLGRYQQVSAGGGVQGDRKEAQEDLAHRGGIGCQGRQLGLCLYVQDDLVALGQRLDHRHHLVETLSCIGHSVRRGHGQPRQVICVALGGVAGRTCPVCCDVGVQVIPVPEVQRQGLQGRVLVARQLPDADVELVGHLSLAELLKVAVFQNLVQVPLALIGRIAGARFEGGNGGL